MSNKIEAGIKILIEGFKKANSDQYYSNFFNMAARDEGLAQEDCEGAVDALLKDKHIRFIEIVNGHRTKTHTYVALTKEGKKHYGLEALTHKVCPKCTLGTKVEKMLGIPFVEYTGSFSFHVKFEELDKLLALLKLSKNDLSNLERRGDLYIGFWFRDEIWQYQIKTYDGDNMHPVSKLIQTA